VPPCPIDDFESKKAAESNKLGKSLKAVGNQLNKVKVLRIQETLDMCSLPLIGGFDLGYSLS